MSLRTGLETCALLSKHLRTYTPLIAVMGSSKSKEIRQRALSDLASSVLESEETKADICLLLSNLLGEEVDNLGMVGIVDKVKDAWRRNDMNHFFYLLKGLGVIENKDIANLAWIETNWRK